MKRILLTSYLLLSCAAIFAQVDSSTAWETGKVIADGVASATGQRGAPWYQLVSAVAIPVFGWVWHVTHLKKKHAKELDNLK